MKYFYPCLILILVALFDMCASPHRALAQGAKPVVATTTNLIADAVSEIAGPLVTITALMGEGVDPHTYKASPGDVRILTSADVIFYNGLHLEGRLADTLIRLAARKNTVQVTELIDPSLLREPKEFQGNYDPHVWFDVTLWMKAIERVREALIGLDPLHKDTYSANAVAYLARLQSLHQWAQSEMLKIPERKRILVTAHDAFGYFGRAYGIEVHGVQGISTDSEASLRDINALVDLLVTRNVPAVFFESSVPKKAVEALLEGAKARGHAIRVGGELFSDSLGARGSEAGTYEGMFRHNVRTIVEGLTR